MSRFPLLLCLLFFFPLTSSISLVLEVHRGNYTSKHLSWLHYRRGRQEGGKGRMLEKRWGLKLDEYKALVMVAFINDSQQLSVGFNFLHVSVYLTFLRCPENLHDDGKPLTFTFVFFFICTWTGMYNMSQKHYNHQSCHKCVITVQWIFLITFLAPPAGLGVNVMFSVGFFLLDQKCSLSGQSAECAHFNHKRRSFFHILLSHTKSWRWAIYNINYINSRATVARKIAAVSSPRGVIMHTLVEVKVFTQ